MTCGIRTGVFEAKLDGVTAVVPYQLEVTWRDSGEISTIDDPYRFGLLLGDLDLYLIGEGRHQQLQRVLGAHPAGASRVSRARASRCGRPTRGASASSATGTGGTGACTRCGNDCRKACGNCSCPASRPVRATSSSWRLPRGPPFLKADPCAAAYELPPATASIVCGESQYVWQDGDWIAQRVRTPRGARPADGDLRGAPRVVGPRCTTASS